MPCSSPSHLADGQRSQLCEGKPVTSSWRQRLARLNTVAQRPQVALWRCLRDRATGGHYQTRGFSRESRVDESTYSLLDHGRLLGQQPAALVDPADEHLVWAQPASFLD